MGYLGGLQVMFRWADVDGSDRSGDVGGGPTKTVLSDAA